MACEKLIGVPHGCGHQVLTLHQSLYPGEEAPSLLAEVGLELLDEARARFGATVRGTEVQSAPDEAALVAHERRNRFWKLAPKAFEGTEKQLFLSDAEADESTRESGDGLGPFGRASR